MKLIFSAIFKVKPQSKQSTSFDTRSGRKGHSYTNTKKADYVKELSQLAKFNSINRQSRKPIFLSVIFNFKHQKKRGIHTCRPDIDNLLKPLKDALSGIVYKDDSQVFSISASRAYSDENSINIQVYEEMTEGALSA